jgi:hypothetical protein
LTGSTVSESKRPVSGFELKTSVASMLKTKRR